jgi:hypothetical protein
MRVTNEYSEFKQFVMQTVSAEDIAHRFLRQQKNQQVPAPVKVKKNGELEIHKFGE